MIQISRVLLSVLLAAVILSCATVCNAQKNLFDDPGFEKTGIPGDVKSGERSGYLAIGQEVPWAPMAEVKIKVEPFATYRITGYAKGTYDTGALTAMYIYSWNSYDWAYVAQANIPNGGEWSSFETSFTSPDNVVTCHPLVFHSASNGKGWIDDVSIVKTLSPKETIMKIEAKPEKVQQDIQLLARYYLLKNNPARAASFMAGADTFTKSDVACFRAKITKNKQARIPFILEMIQNNGMTYHNAEQRLSEMTAGFTTTEKVLLAEKIASKLPGGMSPAKACAHLMNVIADTTASLITLSEKSKFVKAAERIASIAKKSYYNDQAAKKEVEPAVRRIEVARDDLNEILLNPGTRTIYVNGKLITKQDYVTAIPDKPTPQERFAARDLVSNLEIITGKTLAIVREAKVGKRSALYIGKTKLAVKSGINFKKLGLEGISIKTSGKNLILAGNKRGVLYACYTLLEDYLGCRWYTPDCSTIPNKGTVKLSSINKTFIPKLEHRSTDYPHSRNQDWAVRNKINGNQPNIDEQRGNCIRYQGFVHTFNYLVPPEQYFAQHPEYFSEINGVRIGPAYTQLCLTNPDVLKITIDNVKKWFKEAPDATIVSVSQNDWGNYCQCDNCAALAKEEGSQCGPLLHFINAIADAVKDEYPDKIIDTLAYQWSRKPPLHVKPRPNVVVRLCSIECCFVHPLETCEFNSSFVTDIQNWHKISNRLWMWDYVINYAHTIMPFPNLYSLKPNIDFFINNGVTGIYEEADYYTKGGELAELRTWIMAKTLWDPSYDTDKAIDEFLNAYYGPAAKPIRSYVNLIHKQIKDNPKLHMTIYYPPTSGHLTPEVIKKSNELFDQAESMVKNDDKLLHRVQVARLPIMYTMIALGYNGYVQKDNKLVMPTDRVDGGLPGAFEKIARKEGVTMINEGTSLDTWLASLGKRGEEIDIVKLSNKNLEVNILPAAGGRIWKMIYLPTNKNLLKIYGKEDSYQITTGGYEEYSSMAYRSDGWGDVYKVSEQSRATVRLDAELKNELIFTRIYTLDDEAPVIHIKSTLTNKGGASIQAGIRVHPEFEINQVTKGFVATRKPDGKWTAVSLLNKKDPDTEKEIWLRGNDKPNGEWAVIDSTDGIGIINRFDNSAVDLAYYNWFGIGGRVNLELFPKEVFIKPGESITLTHSYEIMPNAMTKLQAEIE